MNRKLALMLTVVIFAAIAFCFLRPMDSYGFVTYGEFGNIKSVYLEGDVEIPIKVSGETDLLTVTGLEFDGQGSAYIYFRPAEGRMFSMGSVDVNFEVHPWQDGTPFDLASVERYEDGEWVHYTDIDNFAFGMPAIDYTTGPFVITRDELRLPLDPPLVEPGRYRVTFNFREAFGDRDSGFSCEDTVHHITMEYEIPAASGSRYDLAYLVVLEPEWRGFTRLQFVLRANEGEAPYRKYDKVDVEKLENGSWVKQKLLYNDAVPNFYQRWDYRRSDYKFAEYHTDLTRALDLNSEYRITMYFTEEEYSEDYFPLQIHIRTLDPFERIFGGYYSPTYTVYNIGLQFIAK